MYFIVHLSFCAFVHLFFEKMFEMDMKEKQTKIWCVKENIKRESFQEFIEYIYTSKIILTFQVNFLKKLCC